MLNVAQPAAEPLVRLSDVDEYKAGLARYQAKEWDDERFTAHRVRFGVYGQLQPGVQMVRIKVPGGIVPVSWLRLVSAINRKYAKGEAHITTRQDFQLYYVPLAETPSMLAELYGQGMTTREACGNTLRNMTSCSLAGICPREHVDAGMVASRLARAWLRHPLAQHMPRKFKISVSGCATDCGHSGIHDLALIATKKDGKQGFRLIGGGGTGGQAIAGTEISAFCTEEEIPTALEAILRIHQRYSNRRNRNAARIKFVHKRFGSDKFRALFAEEFDRIRALPQRPWEKLDWREPTESETAALAASLFGVIKQHDGLNAVVANPPLGLLSSDVMDALADLADRHGITELRATREQNLIFTGVKPAAVEALVAGIRKLGLAVQDEANELPDVISCPGTTSCRIGITNSQNFGKEVVKLVQDMPAARGTRVRISGCQNGCGLHHVGDFGFHGMGKKIEGHHAPHYQIHLGGDPRRLDGIAVPGPIVPAKLARRALELLLEAHAAVKASGESIHDWATRLGKDGLEAILKPLAEIKGQEVFTDWGETREFKPPAPGGGDCAAPFAMDDLFTDLADDALIGLDRALFKGLTELALDSAARAVLFGARRLLAANAVVTKDEDPAGLILSQLRSTLATDGEILATLDKVEAARNGDIAAYRETVALWLDTVRARCGEDGEPAEVAAE